MIIDTLHSVIDKLNEIEIPYMLSGSVAMSFYTVSRSTRDIDFVIYLKMEQVDRMEEIFAGDYFNKESVIVEIKRNGMFNVILNSNGFKIDFILVKNDRFGKQEFERRKLIYDYGKPIYVVSLEDLIISKLIWIQELFSERQYTDIENMIIGNKLDEDYIKYWITELKLKTFDLFKSI
ncbi:MAG: hypothetical protein JWP81_4093 [Ferruginibacter sp.]|nr:hypothetical protein [Ferruginibacter sp.]